jgi:hypothetical protein
VCGRKGLAATAGHGGSGTGQDGQSESPAECHAEVRVRETEAAGCVDCLEPRGDPGAGHAAVPCWCDQSVKGAAVQALE